MTKRVSGVYKTKCLQLPFTSFSESSNVEMMNNGSGFVSCSLEASCLVVEFHCEDLLVFACLEPYFRICHKHQFCHLGQRIKYVLKKRFK